MNLLASDGGTRHANPQTIMSLTQIPGLILWCGQIFGTYFPYLLWWPPYFPSLDGSNKQIKVDPDQSRNGWCNNQQATADKKTGQKTPRECDVCGPSHMQQHQWGYLISFTRWVADYLDYGWLRMLALSCSQVHMIPLVIPQDQCQYPNMGTP